MSSTTSPSTTSSDIIDSGSGGKVIAADFNFDSAPTPSTSQRTAEVVVEDEQIEIHTPLTYQIPEELMNRAGTAERDSASSFWTYTLYRGPGGESDKVRVHYCKSKDTTEKVAQYFLDKDVIGFDIEWKPDSKTTSGIKKNVALIQIASEERIALFHIALYAKDNVEDLVAPTLKKIMEDSNITKVGVAIKADCTRLRNFLEIDAKGIFELSHLYKLVKYSASGDYQKINRIGVSLATQVQEHLQLPMFKGEVRSSDWSQPLSMDQIVCVSLFRVWYIL